MRDEEDVSIRSIVLRGQLSVDLRVLISSPFLGQQRDLARPYPRRHRELAPPSDALEQLVSETNDRSLAERGVEALRGHRPDGDRPLP